MATRQYFSDRVGIVVIGLAIHYRDSSLKLADKMTKIRYSIGHFIA